MDRYDLVIVGGSFAGLACARTAALRGLKVAVLDAKSEPGARVRTTGILVKEAIDDSDLPAGLMRKIYGVRLYAPGGKSLDLHAPGYFFQATDTAGLLRWMAGEAERAGATLFYGRKFIGGEQDGDGVRLPDMAARFLIGADGPRSTVAAFFGLGLNRRFLVGLEIECEPADALDGRFLHCFADSAIAPGYIGWAVPGVHGIQVGAAAIAGRKPALAALLDRLSRIGVLPAARIFSRRSGLIPVGGPVSAIGCGRVMLIGDAAGLVSPVTGGGIHTALHFGRRAAQPVSDHLTDRGPDPRTVFAREIPRFRKKLLLRRLLDFAPPNAAIDALLMTGPARRLAQRLYFHRRGGNPAEFDAWSRAFEAGGSADMTTHAGLRTL
jgi:flavin-dependent dehydrogenase